VSGLSGQARLIGPEVTVRDMLPADIPAVHELEVRLFPVDAWPLQMFVDELSQPETRRYLIAETPDGIIGYAGLMCIEPIADVQTIAVIPEYEGKGIGTALLTELINESRRRGAADVLLEVRADNPRAQQLYRRFGFEQIHVRRNYYRDGVDALIMRLELADVLAVHQEIVHQDPVHEDPHQDPVHQDPHQDPAGQQAHQQPGDTTATEADQQ
jgi:ribosomal-protein-alanine N-acetyltransferase